LILIYLAGIVIAIPAVLFLQKGIFKFEKSIYQTGVSLFCVQKQGANLA